MSAVTVEEVAGGKALARFVELPHALHGSDPRFAPLVLTWERYRLDPRRNPFFERGDGAYFLARWLGRPAGRITAHVAGPGEPGLFGFWWVDDHAEVASALVDAAQAWLAERGCTSMTGPVSFTPAEELGVQVAGFDAAGLTGRPWHPPHLAEHLRTLGFEEVDRFPTWRLELDPGGSPPPAAVPQSADVPGHAGRQADRRLVLPTIAAVPDLSPALRQTGARSLWSVVQRARAKDWTIATVVRWSPERIDHDVAELRRAASAAGYRVLVAPGGASARPPDVEHALFRTTWS